MNRVIKMHGGGSWARLGMYLITLNYTLKDDYEEILCYVHCHNKKIEEKIKKKFIHTQTNLVIQMPLSSIL